MASLLTKPPAVVNTAFINTPYRLLQQQQPDRRVTHRSKDTVFSHQNEQSGPIKLPPSGALGFPVADGYLFDDTPAGIPACRSRWRTRANSTVDYTGYGGGGSSYVRTSGAISRLGASAPTGSEFRSAGLRKQHMLSAGLGSVPQPVPPAPAPAANKSGRDGSAKNFTVGSENRGRVGGAGDHQGVMASQKDHVRRIKAAGLRGDWRGVSTLLNEMRAMGVPRNVFVYNTAISALARCRRPWDAEDLLDVMLDKENLTPDNISYNSAINGHARCGDLESARRVLELMRTRFVKPDVVTFNTLADAAAKNGDPIAAAEVKFVSAMEPTGGGVDVLHDRSLFVASKNDE